jgi:choline-sulfatase
MYGDAGAGPDGSHPRVPPRITDRASLKQWIDGYDTAIRFVDDAIARIVAILKQAGVYEETAIIISADHGENQGDLGIYGEHGTADHATCHIPFIVKWPGGPVNKVDDALHYHLDWAPTLMDLLDAGEPYKPAIWDGQSFAGTFVTGAPRGRDQLVISQCAHVCQRSVRFNDGGHQWLYVRTYHDGFHLFPRDMLFDLATDPHEQTDRAAEFPHVVREASARLLDWHDAQMHKMARFCSDVVDPLWTVMREGGPYHANVVEGFGGPPRFAEYLDRLEQTGRADGAAALRERHARSPGPAWATVK